MKVTKHEICNIAMERFRRDGFENVSIEDICNACDVTRGSFYHHYKNKYDMLIFWERCNAEKEISRLHDLTESEPVMRLYRYLSTYAEGISSVGCDLLYRIMLGTIEAGSNAASSHKGIGTYIGSDALIVLIMDATETSRISAEELLRLYNMAMTGLVFEWKLSGGGFNFATEANKIAQIVFGIKDNNKKGR